MPENQINKTDLFCLLLSGSLPTFHFLRRIDFLCNGKITLATN